jgi:hypothetical protein
MHNPILLRPLESKFNLKVKNPSLKDMTLVHPRRELTMPLPDSMFFCGNGVSSFAKATARQGGVMECWKSGCSPPIWRKSREYTDNYLENTGMAIHGITA